MLLITSTANIKLEKEITGYMVVYPRWRGELIYSKPSECIPGGLSPLARGTL